MALLTFQQVIAWLFVVCGAVLLGWEISEILDSRASMHWPRVAGSILKSEIVEKREMEGDILYGAHIRFEYAVGAKHYASERIRFGGHWAHSSRHRAKSLVGRYPGGASVCVAYDPSDPANAVLEPGRIRSAVGGVVFSVVCLILGLWGATA
jgi:hypothetical protein